MSTNYLYFLKKNILYINWIIRRWSDIEPKLANHLGFAGLWSVVTVWTLCCRHCDLEMTCRWPYSCIDLPSRYFLLSVMTSLIYWRSGPWPWQLKWWSVHDLGFTGWSCFTLLSCDDSDIRKVKVMTCGSWGVTVCEGTTSDLTDVWVDLALPYFPLSAVTSLTYWRSGCMTYASWVWPLTSQV